MNFVLSWLQEHVAPHAHLHLDSRDVQAGDVFLACPGEVNDGRSYIAQAVVAGASAVVYESAGLAPASQEELVREHPKAVFLPVEGLAALAPRLAAEWYGQPSAQLAVVALTGTNGKTTSTQWLQQALEHLKVPCGVIGTLGARLPGGNTLDTRLTTPDGVSLQRVLATMRDAGARVVALEASSIGLAQGRLDAVQIRLAAFTNLTRDHLDYHGDMASYAAAKARLFRWPGLQAAVCNADDAFGCELLAADDVSAERWSYGWRRPVESGAPRHVSATDVQINAHGVSCRMSDDSGAVPVQANVLGAHNVDNLLLVAALLRALGHAWAPVASALAQLQPIAGRLERVSLPESGKAPTELPLVVVDYAHTPDALEQVLKTLRPLVPHGKGKLHCVFGCGGNRDPGKRPEMGQVAGTHADTVWVTSDNPRDEEPASIIRDIMAGWPAAAETWQVEPERARAIVKAIAAAGPHDVILLAGKGHETWQERAGKREPFHDAAWARLGLLWRNSPRVSTDSRDLQAGDLYIALRGERFDGNDFAGDALRAGACAAVVSSAAVTGPGLCLPLGDGLSVLHHLAACRRDAWPRPLIAVTGSNGKTTTKEMIAAILRAWQGDAAVLATRGNLNNEIGVPLTLLELRPEHQLAVVELGMNHPGEIAVLAALAKPNVGLVNNAQREHQEFMHSVRAVAEENGQVLVALADDGVAVFPNDDEHAPLWQSLAGSKQSMRFAMAGTAEVRAQEVELGADGSRVLIDTPNGEQRLRIPVPGLHNVHNALAATACCLAVGCPLPVVAQGLARFQPAPGRLVADEVIDGVMVIDDTYNANPDSVRAAIDVLATMIGPRALVLGDMGEVGESGPEMHAEVGAYARERGIEHLFGLGDAVAYSVAAFGPAGVHAKDAEAVVAGLLDVRPASALFKGSRFMRMETVLQAWRKRLVGGSGGSDVA